MTLRDLIVGCLIGGANGIAIAKGEVMISAFLVSAFFCLIALRASLPKDPT